MNIIGNGVALDIPKLIAEIKSVTDNGVPAPHIMVSDRAQVMMPYHVLLDTYEEERLADKQFGSTKSGIAPFYSDKYAKIGFQVNELFDEEYLKEKLTRVLEVKNLMLAHIYHKPLMDFEEIFNTLMEYRDLIAPYVGDVNIYVHEALKAGKNILLEGQLGSLKDPDFGIYPMVTSSSTLAGYGAVGAGIPPYEIREIVAVTKAYSSAVGAGEFVSEIFGEEARLMRDHGGDKGEYGATTAAPAAWAGSTAWLPATAAVCRARRRWCSRRWTALPTSTRLRFAPGYEIDGVVTKDFPVTAKLKKAKPVLETLPGFKQEIRGVGRFEDLPQAAQDYVAFIEREIGVPITMVSNGPKRSEILKRK